MKSAITITTKECHPAMKRNCTVINQPVTMHRGIKTNIKHRISIYKVAIKAAFFIAALFGPGVLQHTPMAAAQTLS